MGWDIALVDDQSTALLYRSNRYEQKAFGQYEIIPDVVPEQVFTREHPHAKPVEIQARLIEATTAENDFVVDPAAGSFSVMDSALSVGRRFLGCDLAP